MTRQWTERRAWLHCAAVFRDWALFGICRALDDLERRGAISYRTALRMRNRFAHMPTDARGFIYPLTREGRKKRFRLCMKFAKQLERKKP